MSKASDETKGVRGDTREELVRFYLESQPAKPAAKKI